MIVNLFFEKLAESNPTECQLLPQAPVWAALDCVKEFLFLIWLTPLLFCCLPGRDRYHWDSGPIWGVCQVFVHQGL